MNYPLTLDFKKIALAKQATLTDASSTPIAYGRQKILKLKEELEIFKDKTKEKKVCSIKANKVLDFSASYIFTDLNEESFGSIKRKGFRSIWKATYLLMDSKDNYYATIHEENPYAKVLDELLGWIVGVGYLLNYILNPSYIITTKEGKELFRITKEPSFWGGLFKIEKLSEIDDSEEMRCLMATFMMIFLEKSRG